MHLNCLPRLTTEGWYWTCTADLDELLSDGVLVKSATGRLIMQLLLSLLASLMVMAGLHHLCMMVGVLAAASAYLVGSLNRASQGRPPAVSSS